jgi:cytochrome P450
MDPATHREFAPRFRTSYGSLQLDRAEPQLRAIYRSNLARLAADSVGPGGTSALPYLQRAMLEAVGYLFYGLTPGDALLDELERCLPLLHGPALGQRGWRRKTQAGLDGVTAIISRVSSGRPPEGGSGFRSALRELADANPAAIVDPTITGNFVLISHIAYGDLSALHMWLFKFLSDHPAALDPVRAGRSDTQVVTGGVSDAGTRIVMETIRLEQSEFLYRRVTRSFEYERMRFPAGWMIRFCTQESHRDPAVFAEPDRFIPERFAGRVYAREEYAPFGADAHGCMGSHIAHSLGRMFVEELATGFDWRVVADGPVERGANRHRGHWRPSSLHRIVMTERSG